MHLDILDCCLDLLDLLSGSVVRMHLDLLDCCLDLLGLLSGYVVRIWTY